MALALRREAESAAAKIKPTGVSKWLSMSSSSVEDRIDTAADLFKDAANAYEKERNDTQAAECWEEEGNLRAQVKLSAGSAAMAYNNKFAPSPRAAARQD
jgi:hypothetical protein